MKKKLIYILFPSLLLVGCNDSFLDRFPESTIATENFFKTTNDLELLVNNFYKIVEAPVQDAESDNAASNSEATEMQNLLHGNITSSTAKGWDWEQVRETNYFLENAHKAQGDAEVKKHYIGIVRMLRAQEYYKLIKRYNAVPWFSKSLKDTDTDQLYKGRDSRALVVDSIFADLDYATNYVLPDLGNRTTFNKWYAYGLLARTALHEGTYRKYHDELNMQATASTFLQKAVTACEKIMEEGGLKLETTGGTDQAYEKLFISNDLSKCPEIILFKDFDDGMNVRHDVAMTAFSYVSNLSRSLMESYLVIKNNKAIPFSTLPDYEQTGFTETFKNRDPRYKQTFMYPGFIRPGESKPFIPNMYMGGYPQIKFVIRDPLQMQWGRSYNDLPVMRYAEILLIYAEAKAELETLTQDDVDKTINLLRDRVGMPHLILNEIIADPTIEAIYPNVVRNKNAIMEIRRERRVELACEGFRKDDLMRWKVGKLFEAQQGIFVKQFGVFDVTGDGVADVGIYNSKKDVPPIHLKKILYYLKDASGNSTNMSLSEGDHGYIMFTNDIVNPKKFEDPKYYYFPLPLEQNSLNKNLGETIFW